MALLGTCFTLIVSRVVGAARAVRQAVVGRCNAVTKCVGDCLVNFNIYRKESRIQNFKTLHCFTVWRDKAMHVTHTRNAMKGAITRLVRQNEVRCLETWQGFAEEAIAARAKMAVALKGFLRAGEKRGLNTWHHFAVEKKAAEQRIQAVLRRASPEGTAKLKALYRIRDLASENFAMRKAVMAFVNAATVACFNTWKNVLAEKQAKEDKIRKALARMSPEGRSMLKVIEKLQDIARAKHAMDRAVRAFIMAGPKKAFNVWKQMQGVRMMGLQSTIWLAAQRGHRVGALQELLEALEPQVVEDLIQAQDELGMTPLLWAAKRGFADVVEVLLAFGADLTGMLAAQDTDGSTALHHASRKNHNEIVQLLIAANASINATNADKSAPLHWAARKNNTRAIQMLLNAGAEPDLKNKWGATALDNAKFADHHGSISLLSTDPGERKAAESRLVLERKLRPTEEERELKLQELAADAVARREAGRARLQGMAEQREAQEAAIKDKAQIERRMRAADNVLAKALVPAASKKTAVLGTNVQTPWLDFTHVEYEELERCVLEGLEAGNHTTVVYAERMREGQLRVEQLRAHFAEQDGDVGSSSTPTTNSHRSPTQPKESPIERTLRKQRLAMMKK